MHGRMIHSPDGSVSFQSYSASGDRAINSIGRAALNETLLDAAEATSGVTIIFDARLSDYDLKANRLTFEIGGADIAVDADIVLGPTVSGASCASHSRASDASASSPTISTSATRSSRFPRATVSSPSTRTHCTSGRAARR